MKYTVWWCNVKEIWTSKTKCGYHAPELECGFREYEGEGELN